MPISMIVLTGDFFFAVAPSAPNLPLLTKRLIIHFLLCTKIECAIQLRSTDQNEILFLIILMCLHMSKVLIECEITTMVRIVFSISECRHPVGILYGGRSRTLPSAPRQSEQIVAFPSNVVPPMHMVEVQHTSHDSIATASLWGCPHFKQNITPKGVLVFHCSCATELVTKRNENLLLGREILFCQ